MVRRGVGEVGNEQVTCTSKKLKNMPCGTQSISRVKAGSHSL